MKRLGKQIRTALNADVPAELVAAIATTTHAGRLKALFLEASVQLLSAHKNAQQRPGSILDNMHRLRTKACVDLIRSRMSAIGSRRPTVHQLASLLDSKKSSGNVVAIKKAA